MLTIRSTYTRLVKEWITKMRLSHWDIVIMIPKSAAEFSHLAALNGASDPDCSGYSMSNTPYLEAGIVLHPDKSDPREMEGIVVHELVHILLSPLTGGLDSEAEVATMEQVTTMVSRAMLRAKYGN